MLNGDVTVHGKRTEPFYNSWSSYFLIPALLNSDDLHGFLEMNDTPA